MRFLKFKRKNKKGTSAKQDKIVTTASDKNPDINAEIVGKDFFTYDDPFDIYRSSRESDAYVPITQRGYRKAFSDGVLGIEYYLEMATSLRPFIDETRDIDDITRIFSMQKLANRPNQHSARILRGMIQDPDPEIALYAAEGLNSIENSFIVKIQKIKKKLAKKMGRPFAQHYLLGLLFYEFTKILYGQELIQEFYLKESCIALVAAIKIKRNSGRAIKLLGQVSHAQQKYRAAIKIFKYLLNTASYQGDAELQMAIAECYYNLKNYTAMKTYLISATARSKQVDDDRQQILSHWT